MTDLKTFNLKTNITIQCNQYWDLETAYEGKQTKLLAAVEVGGDDVPHRLHAAARLRGAVRLGLATGRTDDTTSLRSSRKLTCQRPARRRTKTASGTTPTARCSSSLTGPSTRYRKG